MAKKKNEKIENLFYMSGKNDEKQKQKEDKNKVKEREKRIKQNKARVKDEFEIENETVIGMTNNNNQKKRVQQQQKNSKKQKEILKKQKRIKRVLKIVMLLIIIIAGIVFALISPIFNIKEIEVINNSEDSQVVSDTIKSLSGLSTDQNIFKFSKLKIEYDIEKNSYIKSVSIKRKIPNKVVIEIEERERAYNVEFLNEYAYIDTQGYILEISENKLDKPTIKGIVTPQENISEGNRLDVEDLERLEIVIKIIDVSKTYELDSKITSIDITDKNEFIMYIESEKKTIYLGDNTNLSNKILWVEKIIEDNSGVEGSIYVNGDLNNNFKPRFREKV